MATSSLITDPLQFFPLSHSEMLCSVFKFATDERLTLLETEV